MSTLISSSAQQEGKRRFLTLQGTPDRVEFQIMDDVLDGNVGEQSDYPTVAFCRSNRYSASIMKNTGDHKSGKGPMTNQSKVDQLEAVLQRIGSEPLEAVRARERRTFAKFAGNNEEHLILFGAGLLGRLVAQGLERAGVCPIAFVDNNDALWDTEIGGVPVLSPSTASERYRDSACFVVTIYNGSAPRRQLKALGCQNVAPTPALFWKYADVFTPNFGIDLPHKLIEYADEIRACHEILADEHSRRELTGQLGWRYWLEEDSLPAPLDPAGTYFPMELITPSEDEVFVDCGSFKGDTIPGFNSHWNGRFKHIFALEPDPQNREVLQTTTQSMGLADRVTVVPFAVGDKNGVVSFATTGTVTSQILEGGERSPSLEGRRLADISWPVSSTFINVECRRLDDISWTVAPTYIKMDIEGAEPQALIGAADLLRRHYPILAVCTYHRSEHLWQIPNLIRSIAPEYNLFVRRYAEDCWEGICYAIPENRLKRP